MDSGITVERLTHEALEYVAANCREIDRREIRLSVGVGPLLALEVSEVRSVAAWSGSYNGVPMVVFGVNYRGPLDRDVGVPWLVATPELEKHQKGFLRRCKPYVDRMELVFPRMENHVLAENTTAIGWLRWLGFDIGEAVPYGIGRAKFHPFTKG
ncbi:hypothetical protein [uncultured Paraglaciecola sp.]|uniref:hypothetical protein n=1 Tax=uncultured Paraglaciecola sp. TaxID=1765024 RepID=UPI002619EAAF|nr:hypothetical protein [uncultured Paraglaciecola sp.]